MKLQYIDFQGYSYNEGRIGLSYRISTDGVKTDLFYIILKFIIGYL